MMKIQKADKSSSAGTADESSTNADVSSVSQPIAKPNAAGICQTIIMKLYTSEQVSKHYNSLTKDKKIEVLYEALDYMQQYNGRTRFMCIAMALGYDNDEGDNKSYYKVAEASACR